MTKTVNESENQTLESKITRAINCVSAENASNTPDWILAQFLVSCLSAWNTACQQRETWYGRDGRPTLPAAPSEPTEYKRVPVEPTKEMLEAGADQRIAPLPTAVRSCTAIYKAMLSAAPSEADSLTRMISINGIEYAAQNEVADEIERLRKRTAATPRRVRRFGEQTWMKMR